jgi:hypothetical protein
MKRGLTTFTESWLSISQIAVMRKEETRRKGDRHRKSNTGSGLLGDDAHPPQAAAEPAELYGQSGTYTSSKRCTERRTHRRRCDRKERRMGGGVE